MASSRDAKIAVVMGEFKRGTLKSSSGKKVTNRKQALAIANSEGDKVMAVKQMGKSKGTVKKGVKVGSALLKNKLGVLQRRSQRGRAGITRGLMNPWGRVIARPRATWVPVVVRAKAWKRNWAVVSLQRPRPWTRVAGKGKPDANIKSKDSGQEPSQYRSGVWSYAC
jgi:hypothetical protein